MPITRELELRQCDSGLSLIFAFLVLIADLAFVSLVGREEQHLGNPLVGVDLRGEGRRVRDLERNEALPLGLERRHVGDDAAAGVRALADADRQDVLGMRKYSTDRASAKEFGGTIHTSPVNST